MASSRDSLASRLFGMLSLRLDDYDVRNVRAASAQAIRPWRSWLAEQLVGAVNPGAAAALFAQSGERIERTKSLVKTFKAAFHAHGLAPPIAAVYSSSNCSRGSRRSRSCSARSAARSRVS